MDTKDTIFFEDVETMPEENKNTIADAKQDLLNRLVTGGPDPDRLAYAYKLLCDSEQVERHTEREYPTPEQPNS